MCCGRDFPRVTNPIHSAGLEIRENSSNLPEEKLSEKLFQSARPPDSVFRTLGRVIVNVTSARTSRKPSSSTGSSPALGAIEGITPANAGLALRCFRGVFLHAALF